MNNGTNNMVNMKISQLFFEYCWLSHEKKMKHVVIYEREPCVKLASGAKFMAQLGPLGLCVL